MAKRNVKKMRRLFKLSITFAIVFAIFVGVCSAAYLTNDEFKNKVNELLNISVDNPQDPTPQVPLELDEIRVHVINVDQADCILIETPDGCMLIDTGIDETENHLKNYLTSCGITTIDYLVITHAHADHYEGADMILREFEVKNFVYDNYNYSNQTKPRELLKEVAEKGISVYDAKVGAEYTLGNATFTVMCADMKDATNKNDYSIVLRLDYGESSFLFTGDATKFCESYMIETWSEAELDCDFLKSGHHGSYTSSGQAFLDVITPDMVAISCGVANEYGHPHKEVMDRYEKMEIDIYRTDTSGDLVFVCDGETITYDADFWN